ncbi:hypothetical protein A4R28_32345 (plasmid) [Mesorhizobium ciceri]|uniref:Shedu anti-phage system protein SduA domain-containing protein n=2 Tax=Mesorhizobium TaxID=68287 RepID=UPI0007A948FD|nr:hypothetical protein A4R28_32345 [Mesorhizobium ciceri]
MNQVLEQRYNLVANIHIKRSIDDNMHIDAWSVPCFLIIGTSPQDKWLRQSFELFRGNQREVVVITFDELLGKLKAVHEFLSTNPLSPTRTTALSDLGQAVGRQKRTQVG